MPLFGWAKSDPTTIAGREVDLESPLMHNHLVMEPAEDHEVFLIGLATLGPGDEMMDLETTTRVAPVGAAHVVVVGE